MNRTPLILAIVLLLLPVLYVGSYLAVVKPGGIEFRDSDGMTCVFLNRHYSVAETLEHSAGRIFWPLEQIDRRVRPGAWKRQWMPYQAMKIEFGPAMSTLRPQANQDSPK